MDGLTKAFKILYEAGEYKAACLISAAIIEESTLSSSKLETKDWIMKYSGQYSYLEAIKEYRAEFGIGLKEAKELIDKYKQHFNK